MERHFTTKPCVAQLQFLRSKEEEWQSDFEKINQLKSMKFVCSDGDDKLHLPGLKISS